ncbi:MAG: NAD(P)/FAD-dependent oxidoreductase [Granulosicoccus sp.]
MSVECECVVIGAGVVGLAIAARLAEQGREVVIVEAEADFGTVSSARNSEVIHAGIYYAKNSLKARYCVRGKHLLYAYCQQRQIPYRQCGKLIVATDDGQLQQLEQIRLRARANGVVDMETLTMAQAHALEPSLACTGALLSHSTGILDSHAFMVSLLGDAENHGAVLVCRTRVEAIIHHEHKDCYELSINDGEERSTLTASQVINAAGHGACSLSGTIAQIPETHRAQPLMYKGNYFSLAIKSPFSRLVYPVPEAAGLGVHLTIDMAGRARFGPDVEPVDTEDYRVDPARAEGFTKAIRKYWPDLPDNALLPDYSGIRPRVRIGGELYPDFMLQGPADHGLSGLINLLSIESPGLTASLAIAEAVTAILHKSEI